MRQTLPLRLGFILAAMLLAGCSPLASTLLGEPNGTTPLATATPIIGRDMPLSPSAAAAVESNDRPPHPRRTLSRLCLDDTFYGIVETRCAWGQEQDGMVLPQPPG